MLCPRRSVCPKRLYLPQPTKDYEWPDKQKFLAAVKEIEDCSRLDDVPTWIPGTYDKELMRYRMSRVRMRGQSISRLEPVAVGSQEYYAESSFGRKKITWPAGYAEHYIGKWNVMPTRRFFNFIVKEFWTDGKNLSIEAPGCGFHKASRKFGEAEGYWDPGQFDTSHLGGRPSDYPIDDNRSVEKILQEYRTGRIDDNCFVVPELS